MDWVLFFKKNQINHLYHEFGSLDSIVRNSSIILGKTAGNSGEIGFTRRIHPKFKNKFKQSKCAFKHSDYFLPLHMEEAWLGFLLEDKQTPKYSRAILRREVIERLYSNYNDTKTPVSLAVFFARIDSKGNYHAHYRQEGVNENHQSSPMKEFDVVTAADAVHGFGEMSFTPLNKKREILEASVVEDKFQKKHVRINFREPVGPGEHFELEYRFKWKGTMSLELGDTDHFWITETRNIRAYLNFQRHLKSPAFYLVSDKKIKKELPPKVNLERDGTVTYSIEIENKENSWDGLIFCFEGQEAFINTHSEFLGSPHKFSGGDGKNYIIEKCMPDQIREVYSIESKIERGNAANEETLFERLNCFNDGFLVAKNERGKVVGYIECVLWDDFQFSKFEQISDFPLHYKPNGDTLYIIFVGVDSKYRGRYIGLELVKIAVRCGEYYNTKKIKLIAKDSRIGLYQKCGFNYIKEMPTFLEKLFWVQYPNG